MSRQILFVLFTVYIHNSSLLSGQKPRIGLSTVQTGKYNFLNIEGGEGNGTPLQYSCLENPMDGGAWWAAVHGVAKSRTRLSDFTFTFRFHALEKEMATPLQCSCLENPRGRETWWAAIYGVTQSRTRLK